MNQLRQNIIGPQHAKIRSTLTIAADLLDNTTKSRLDDDVINSFITTMRSTLLGAVDRHDNSSYLHGCHRYDDQAEMMTAALAAMARCTNNSATIQSLAGISTAAGPERSWPQQMQGTIYGNKDRVRTCQDPGDAGDGSSPEAAPTQITDRRRTGADKPFGYSGGNMLSMIEIEAILQNAGHRPCQFTGTKGQSLRLELDHYSWHVKTFPANHIVQLPDTADHPDFAQQAGNIHTIASCGSMLGSDSLPAPCIIGNQVDANDPRIVAALDEANSPGTTAYVPGSELEILVMMIER